MGFRERRGCRKEPEGSRTSVYFFASCAWPGALRAAPAAPTCSGLQGRRHWGQGVAVSQEGSGSAQVGLPVTVCEIRGWAALWAGPSVTCDARTQTVFP